MISPEYLAGFVDGEGCISFSKTRSAYYPRITITNTNLDILEEIKEEHGGYILRFTRTALNSKWKNGYVLTMGNRKCVDFIEFIIEHLNIKFEQAMLVIFWDIIRPGATGKRWDKESMPCMNLLLDQSKWLNEKGIKGQTEISPMDKIIGWSRNW